MTHVSRKQSFGDGTALHMVAQRADKKSIIIGSGQSSAAMEIEIEFMSLASI